jgi:hypothetical protein
MLFASGCAEGWPLSGARDRVPARSNTSIGPAGIFAASQTRVLLRHSVGNVI